MGPVRHHTGMTVSPVSPVLRPLSRLTVLAGPTAVGKGTIVTELRRRHPDLFVSVSATTRAPRPGEIDGVHYHFVSDAEFDRLISTGQMLEWALVHGTHRYGTPAGPSRPSSTPAAPPCSRSTWPAPGRSGSPCRPHNWFSSCRRAGTSSSRD